MDFPVDPFRAGMGSPVLSLASSSSLLSPMVVERAPMGLQGLQVCIKGSPTVAALGLCVSIDSVDYEMSKT